MATTEKAPRLVLAGMLRPLLPRAWRIVPSQTNLDTLSTTVVMLKQMSLERHPIVPQGAHLVSFVVTIISPLHDTEKAEDDLDDKVNALIHALDTLDIEWTRAEKVLAGATLGYDITLTLTSRKGN